MAAWSDGYFTDVQYTDHFYPELAPGYLAFACLRQGVRPPRLQEGAAYLELGCGQGFGLNLLAAANPQTQFWGVDFHPGQIDNASTLAGTAGLTNVTFADWSFEQMLELPVDSLPKFDAVALHGIWSWVSPDNRTAIARILDRWVKPGGVVYVSYNCLPTWSAIVPLQRFVADHVARGSGPTEQRILEAFRAALTLAEHGGYLKSVPWLKSRIEGALKEKPAYLIHEYLNAHSHPFFFADVAQELDSARLTFAASANLADDIVRLAAPAALQPMIAGTTDPVWRETLLDHAGSRPFRRDIFVRGRNLLSPVEREATLGETRFALLVAPEAASFAFQIPIGQMTGAPGLYRPIIEALAEGPHSYDELRALPALTSAAEGALLQALTLLVGSRQVHPVAAWPVEGAQAFNRALLQRMEFDELPGHLASPLVGTGVQVGFEDLVALARAVRGEDAATAARWAWPIMARTGRRLRADGAVLQDQGANEAELQTRIAALDAARLPALRGLNLI